MFLFPAWRKKKYPFLKDNEVWFSVFVMDIVSIPLVLVLKKLSKKIIHITPNAISFTSFFIFVLALFCLYMYPDKNVLYTFLFFFSGTLDSTDGQFARATDSGSNFGAIIDAFFDMLTQGVGIIFVGLALNKKIGNPYPLIVLSPYALLLGIMHINHITITVLGLKTEYKKREIKGRWRKFCDKRGLTYFPYDHIEIIFISILFFGININNPTIFLLCSIYPALFFLLFIKKD